MYVSKRDLGVFPQSSAETAIPCRLLPHPLHLSLVTASKIKRYHVYTKRPTLTSYQFDFCQVVDVDGALPTLSESET